MAVWPVQGVRQRDQLPPSAGQKKRDYPHITVPVLAMFEYPRVDPPLSDTGAPQTDTNAQRVAREAYVHATAAYVDAG